MKISTRSSIINHTKSGLGFELYKDNRIAVFVTNHYTREVAAVSVSQSDIKKLIPGLIKMCDIPVDDYDVEASG